MRLLSESDAIPELLQVTVALQYIRKKPQIVCHYSSKFRLLDICGFDAPFYAFSYDAKFVRNQQKTPLANTPCYNAQRSSKTPRKWTVPERQRLLETFTVEIEVHINTLRPSPCHSILTNINTLIKIQGCDAPIDECPH
jgi:hypothetical protein